MNQNIVGHVDGGDGGVSVKCSGEEDCTRSSVQVYQKRNLIM